MDTMRRGIVGAGGLLVCVLVAAFGVRAADSVQATVESNEAESAVLLLDDVSPDRLIPLPDTYKVKRRFPDGHPLQNGRAGAAETCAVEETKAIYTSKLGTFAFRPGRGRRIADDLITELVRDCTMCSLQVRVTGGVEGGDGTFIAEFSLYDGCPAAGQGGQEIPGTELRFSNLEDDAEQFHDLIIDYSDRGLCDDGLSCLVSQQDCVDLSVCVEDPLEIPATVWLRLRFDTDEAAIVTGSPPTRGFSADAYDDPQGHCTAWFAGWPSFPHATMFAEILALATCETHFLAYLASDPTRPAFLPSDLGDVITPGGTRPPLTNPTTRLGDDINLTVDSCVLSAYELGMKGTAGAFTMDIDIRWPNITDSNPSTPDDEDANIRHAVSFSGRGDGADGGSAEVGHFTIDEDVNLAISINDQPIFITWASNKINTGAMEVNLNQAGTSSPLMLAFDVDPVRPDEWVVALDGDNTPAVFYAAIFCRGDEPRGACCPDQLDIPGSDMNCFDDVPVTSCLGSRWQINSTCEDNLFNPPCGTHACCGPSSNCGNRTRDDCLEDCITDVDPISCAPVCVGGANFDQPCDPGNGDADCAPDGTCDADAQCPGERTCGLEGCQLNGEFTGRPCDRNNPGQGNSDCMTCSGSGDYCRARCTDGIRRGRACDDDADCPGSACDDGFDCSGTQTCDAGAHVCALDDGLCSLRCARWGSGTFCGVDAQFCPSFTCFDAVGDCFEAEPERACFGRCSISRVCTTDANCEPVFGTCVDGRCTGVPCRFDSDCAPNLGVCTQDDRDCLPGTHCLHNFGICTGRDGCDQLQCCGSVCAIRPECCDGSQGETWDNSCVSTANDFCTFPPGNDDCFSTSPNEGASEVVLEDDSSGATCTPASESCSGTKRANNAFAGSEPSDPGFCCNNRGAGVGGAGTIWFKFEAMHESARIHTCSTPGSVSTVNSIVQVFKALDPTNDGNDEDECNSLEVIGCNDDSGCGVAGENCAGGGCQASVCVVGLNIGETYYILMAASQAINQGRYDLDIESPCPTGTEPPVGSICELAVDQFLPDDPAGVPFDLTGASLDCPAEPQLPGMTNDTWFLAQASCTGNLIVQTCGFDLGEPNPDTTLAVYRTDLSFECPPTNLVGWNDDATISPACSIGGDACDADEDCKLGCEGTGTQCDSDPDCPGASICDDTPRAVCETVESGIGESSRTHCVRAICAADSDCPDETECTNGICDSDDSLCPRGVCEHDLTTPCDATLFGLCTDGAPCDGITACVDGSECVPQCGFNGNENRPWECIAQESCVIGECVSQCSPASYVVVPTFPNQWFFVRLGGKFGSEPSGTIRLSCEADDCNSNGIPDGIEIDLGIAQDCNENRVPDLCDLDTGLSRDCNCNEVPDECEIDANIPVDCAGVPGPCESGPFYCFFNCDPDVNENGIPDCCDADVPPTVCPDCQDVGACCDGTSCAVVTQGECAGEGGIFFGLDSTCDIPDADGDGLRDECDGCPADPKKIEPGICGCGVDDTVDSDGDGVPDCIDQCPGVDDEDCLTDQGACCLGTACSIATQFDCLESGGTFFGLHSTCDVPDADGDGLRDECDGCPDDPNKTEPGICGCGVDDTADSDGDGVPDCVDQGPGEPVFKLWVTEVYEVNPDGSYTPKCSANCPTQDLAAGIAQPGDLINIDVTVEGWDTSTDTGVCFPTGESCSVSAQNCNGSHCSDGLGSCTVDANCFAPSTCDPDSCEKSPLLGAFQWTIDSSTYSNGGAGPGLAPAELACTIDADCACAYTEVPGFLNDCADYAALNSGFCTCTQGGCNENVCSRSAAAYIDSSPIQNYVFSGHSSLTAIDISSPDYTFAALSLDGSVGGVPEELFRCTAGARPICNVDADCPSGTCELVATSPYYLGTILLEATGESCGLFTLDLVQDLLGGVPNSTFLNDNIAGRLPTPIVETLTIDIGGQSEDCNGNGVPDECDTPVCGDGCIMGTEECDDGNTKPGDGCDENCMFDPGACCLGMACSIAAGSECLDSGGTFFGPNSTCDAPDADGDGLRNECDGCPADSNKIEPGICGCGVDDTADSDHDGVPDCEDLCPGADDAVFGDCTGTIPTVSAWGLMILALLLLAGSKIAFRDRFRRLPVS